ncbi:MAG TPA: hypothetical protein VLF94_07570 [Chlamydiales bacterium]|nr:hypothetical protein [Chlamydiales bacterium]
MANYAIRFDRFVAGPTQLSSQLMAPAHKRRLESALSTHFLNQKIDFSQSKNIPFHLDNVALVKGPGAKEIQRVTSYYQHMGLLPRKEIAPQDADLRARVAKAASASMQKATIPGTSSQVLAGAKISEETLSIVRNAMYAIPELGKGNRVVDHLGYYAGVLWSFFALRELNGGLEDLDRAKKVGDGEGKSRAQARLVSGGIVSAASFTYLSGKVFDSFESAVTGTAVLGAANLLFGVGSFLSVAMSGLGWYRCHQFNERLNEYLENPQLSEAQKLQGALQFLKDAVFATPEEIDQLRSAIEKEHPELSSGEKEALLKQRLEHLTETKVKSLKRRTSNKSLHWIVNQVDPLLTKLNDENTRAGAVKEAMILIQKVQKETWVKMALYVLGAIAALISIAGLMALTFFTAGALPYVLYGIAGMIYLAVQIYNSAGLFASRDTNTNIEMNPIQDIGSLEPHHAIL